ncbi:MAG: flagellar basal-body MS-ring/collar protein FliF [Dehalococcoidia bacterium]
MAPFLRRLTDTWGELTPIRKGLLTGSALLLVAVVFGAYSWSSQTTYATLYSGLDASDSGAIVEELRASNTPYRLEVNGSTVLVPQSQVNDLRVQFASKGMPAAGHTGFEVFSGNSFTATDFVQRLNFQRGLQGELERTLEAFPAVQQARVHVVMPQKSLFKNDQQPATASVVLALRPGRSLQDNEVAGMAHLVAGAVEGLDREHITILNTAGKMIFDGASQTGRGGIGAASTQLTMQSEFERQLAANVQSMLDRTLGPSKATVNVSASLNFDQIETQTEKYTQPENGAARSSKSVKEAYTTNASTTAGEIPGAVANVPGANANLPGGTQPAATGGSGTNYERTETTSNFELDKVLTKQVAASGGVKRLSVSLLLDESIAEDKTAALEASVAAAAGIDKERGDTIVVTRVPFDRSLIEEANQAFAAEASRDLIFSYVRIALPVVALVAVFVFTRMLMRSLGRRGGPQAAYAAAPEGFAPGMSLPMGAGAGMALPDVAANAIRALPPPPLEEVKRSDLEISVSRMAEQHPETVAEVVQSWLRED